MTKRSPLRQVTHTVCALETKGQFSSPVWYSGTLWDCGGSHHTSQTPEFFLELIYLCLFSVFWGRLQVPEVMAREIEERFFVLLLGASIPFDWVSRQGFCRTKDDIFVCLCVCGVIWACTCPSESVCRCSGTGVRMGRPKDDLPLLLSPLLLETVSASLTESRTQHSSRLPGQSASPGEPSASTVSVLGLQACTMETVFPRDQIQVSILRGECLAMDPPSQSQYQFIT